MERRRLCVLKVDRASEQVDPIRLDILSEATIVPVQVHVLLVTVAVLVADQRSHLPAGSLSAHHSAHKVEGDCHPWQEAVEGEPRVPTSNQQGLGQDAQAETSSRGVGVLTTAGRLARIDGGSRGIGELGMRNVGRMDG